MDIPQGTCERSLAFMIEGEKEADMGAMVMELWLAYRLVKWAGWEFFVIDRNW